MKLILGQGNPEARYDATRHNIGWVILDAFAAKAGSSWKFDKKHNADITTVALEGEKLLLVKPKTYYNETGRTAQSLVQFYKLTPQSDVLVIHDDLALPFGTLRIRERGSDAGNNGIKSLNAHLGEQYARIRVGVWNELKERMGDADFVLSNFSKKEQEQITSDITPAVTQLFSDFAKGTLEIHSQKSLRL